MKLTDIAARLRMAPAEMNALADLTEDTDLPDDFVPAFILNFVLDVPFRLLDFNKESQNW